VKIPGVTSNRHAGEILIRAPSPAQVSTLTFVEACPFLEIDKVRPSEIFTAYRQANPLIKGGFSEFPLVRRAEHVGNFYSSAVRVDVRRINQLIFR
jgi:hypothetical protein